MLNYDLLKTKKGQVAETITWVVATIIIIFLLITTIYISGLLGKGKDISKADIGLSSSDSEWIEVKTNLAYLTNSENKVEIDLWINQEEGN